MAKFLDLTGLGQFKTKIQEWAQGVFIPNTRKVNNKPLSADITLGASDVGAIPTSQKGTANGVASLDESGKVPSAQLPSYVDDVLEGYLHTDGKFYKEEAHTTVINGEAGKIYTDMKTNKTYRWSGTAFVEISASLALGETSSTAFPGDKGKTAYDHSQAAHAPANAEANVQSDWSESNTGSDAYIKNKPTSLPANGGNADTVGGHTVQTNVPADAKFTDTTYNPFQGASGSAAGGTGLVPAPAKGDNTKYLKGDGTWGVPSFSIPDNYVTDEELAEKGYLTDDDLTAITTGEIDNLFK